MNRRITYRAPQQAESARARPADVTPPLAPAVVEALWRSGAVTVTNERQRTVLHAKLLVGVVRAGPHELRTPVYGYPRQPPVVDWTGE